MTLRLELNLYRNCTSQSTLVLMTKYGIIMTIIISLSMC